MRDATIGMTKLCGPSAPASVYTTLQQVWLQVYKEGGFTLLFSFLLRTNPFPQTSAVSSCLTQQTIVNLQNQAVVRCMY